MSKVIGAAGAKRELPVEPSSNAGPPHPAQKGKGLASVARAIYSNDRHLQFVLFVFMFVVYGAMLAISWRLWRHSLFRLTFNSMLDHLMHGRFDVDPQIVGFEGFERNGRVYAYWGIWCALLRLPLYVIHRMDLDVTVFSFLVAACIAGVAKVRAVLLIRRHAIAEPAARWAIGFVLAYVVLSGSATGFLSISVYQEVIIWAYAFAAIFVYFAVKGLLNRRFDLGALSAMALCTGLALLTRVSTGIGLIVAFLLLLFVLALWPASAEQTAQLPAIRRFGVALAHRRTWVPLAILATFIAATAAVNYSRWGNPATFANYDDYIPCHLEPASCALFHGPGAFNLERIPFGLVYYFFPLYLLRGSDGQYLFNETLTRLFKKAEPPPGAFLLTDLFALCFIIFLVVAVWKRRRGALPPADKWAAAVAVGLLAPCILMLTAVYLAYRYRMEFYPEIEFLVLLGLFFVVRDSAMLAIFARWRRWLMGLLVVGISASFLGSLTADGLFEPGVLQQVWSHLMHL